MSSFSIDDVRGSFTTDVSSFLERIHGRAQAALAMPVLGPETLAEEPRACFTAVADLGHAIYGTTSLVGVESLRESARALEELAHAGKLALERLQRAPGPAGWNGGWASIAAAASPASVSSTPSAASAWKNSKPAPTKA